MSKHWPCLVKMRTVTEALGSTLQCMNPEQGLLGPIKEQVGNGV